MNCTEFKEWLKMQAHPGTGEIDTARVHAESCPACGRLLRLDQAAEQTLRSGLARVEAPESLRVSVAMIAREPRKGRGAWARSWIALPAAAMTLLLFVVVFYSADRNLTSIEQIAHLAEKDHVAGYAMDFRTGEVTDVAGWFRNKLDFEVAVPDLAQRGLVLLGGRKCTLGGKDVAYLFYELAGKPCSLFQLDQSDVKVDLEKGQIYRYPLPDCVVEVWKQGSRVYVLIT
jgi:anti-sigma factor RsiW